MNNYFNQILEETRPGIKAYIKILESCLNTLHTLYTNRGYTQKTREFKEYCSQNREHHKLLWNSFNRDRDLSPHQNTTWNYGDFCFFYYICSKYGVFSFYHWMNQMTQRLPIKKHASFHTKANELFQKKIDQSPYIHFPLFGINTFTVTSLSHDTD
jgi:hypothetical protein